MLSTLGEPLTSLAERAAAQAEELRTSRENLDKLATIVDAMGTRRGFQKLVESEQELRQEQAELARRLVSAGEAVTEGTDAMAREVRSAYESFRGLVDDVRTETVVDLERVGRDTREAVAKIRDELETSLRNLRDHLEILAGPRADVQALRNELDAASLTIRGELKSLTAGLSHARGSIDERLEQFTGSLEDRLAELTRRVGISLAQELDRRFEALARLLEARLGRSAEAVPSEATAAEEVSG